MTVFRFPLQLTEATPKSHHKLQEVSPDFVTVTQFLKPEKNTYVL